MSFMGKRTALITGASGGIGSAIARRLAADDMCVAVHYHTNQRTAFELCSEINASGGMASPFCADVSDSSQVAALFAEVKKQFGMVDVLVNNASIASIKMFTEVTVTEWRKIIGINLDGCFYCSQEALRDMVEAHNGVILNISSIWGISGAACEAPYSASKAAIIGLTKALAQEYGPSGIRINCIAPGVIDTPMNSSLDADTRASLCDMTPLGRFGTPEEIAEAASFLVSDRASFITGQVLSPNGGILI